MKVTRRADWRVIVEITPYSLADFGIDGLDGLAGSITSGKFEVEIAPRRLGDFGSVSMSDRLVSRDIDGDYQRRCDELLAELRRLPRVTDGQVTCTETTTCSHCGLGWEVLTAGESADDSTNQDEHSVEGEPVCCYKGIAEFRAERGIPALAEGCDAV